MKIRYAHYKDTRFVHLVAEAKEGERRTLCGIAEGEPLRVGKPIVEAGSLAYHGKGAVTEAGLAKNEATDEQCLKCSRAWRAQKAETPKPKATRKPATKKTGGDPKRRAKAEQAAANAKEQVDEAVAKVIELRTGTDS